MVNTSVFAIFTLIFIGISSEILFKNDFITCYDDRLVIRFYYFPYGDKTIEYKNIRSCRLLNEDDLNFFQMKSWGMAFSSIWWPLDLHRSWRKYFIIIDVNQWPKIGLTMNDNQTLEVYQLIKEKLM